MDWLLFPSLLLLLLLILCCKHTFRILGQVEVSLYEGESMCRALASSCHRAHGDRWRRNLSQPHIMLCFSASLLATGLLAAHQAMPAALSRENDWDKSTLWASWTDPHGVAPRLAELSTSVALGLGGLAVNGLVTFAARRSLCGSSFQALPQATLASNLAAATLDTVSLLSAALITAGSVRRSLWGNFLFVFA